MCLYIANDLSLSVSLLNTLGGLVTCVKDEMSSDRYNLNSPGHCQGRSLERCRARSQDDVSLGQSETRSHKVSANHTPGLTCCPNQPAKTTDLLIWCQSWNKCWQWNYNISVNLVPVQPSDFSEYWPQKWSHQDDRTTYTLIIMRQFAGHK